MADSLETKAIVQYMASSGVPHIRSSYYCQGHSPGGYHCRPGTDGIGTAVDFQDPYPRDKPGLLAIFDAFLVVESQLAELIYSGATFSIKDGRRVPRYSISGHWSHVHSAVKRGVILQWPIDPVPVEEVLMPAVFARPQGGHVVLQEDGGVFTYNGAPFFGSIPGLGISVPIVGFAWTPSGNGYWILGADGGVFSFGDAAYKGGFNSLPASVKGDRTPIGIVAKGNGYTIATFDPSNDSTTYDHYDFGV